MQKTLADLVDEVGPLLSVLIKQVCVGFMKITSDKSLSFYSFYFR